MRKDNETIKDEPLSKLTVITLVILGGVFFGICYFLYALLSIGKMGGQ
jgi:hypothetical protein